MGTSLWTSSQIRMLRTLLFAGLAALAVAAPAAEAEAEAEADPALVYTNTGVHGVYPYGAAPSVYHHAPVVKTVKTVIPAVQPVVHKPVVYTNTGVHGVYPYGAVPSVYHHAPVVKTVKTVIPAVQTVVHKPVVYSGVHPP